MKRNTKYRVWLRAFGTPVDRLLSIVCRSSNCSLVRSGNNGAGVRAVVFCASVWLFLAFSSCTKVIDVKLTEADKKIVIEGTISTRVSDSATVRISQTKNFDDDNSFNGISGATVTIEGNGGKIYTLHEYATGVYQLDGLYGELDSTYKMTVLLNGATYTAVSTIPAQRVNLDSLWVEELAFGGDENYTIYPQYNDPPGLGNSYRLVETTERGQVKHIFEQNDEFSDGNTITRPLINPDSDLKSGDLVGVELQCIDAAVYQYWFSLEQSATGANQSAAPTNPVTNIQGGALGYFSAYSSTYNSLFIP